MEIFRGRQTGAIKTVVYGPEGIGKSTFASKFPEPLFIDIEGSTRYMDVARTQKPTSWPLLLSFVKEVQRDPTICRTLVLDTADWAEQLCTKHICDSRDVQGIEDIGYGKGYVYVYEEFGRLLNELSLVVDRGVNVVITAHAKMRKFEQPDELGAYDRWEMKLNKQTSPIVKEWADMVLFANYKTIVVNVDGQGAQKGKNKVQGGKRIMYTTHNPCWDAKNRFDLAPELPFDYSEIAEIIAGTSGTQTITVVSKEPKPVEAPPIEISKDTALDTGTIMQESKQSDPESSATKSKPNDYSGDFVPEIPDGIPQALKDLMQANNVTATDIQMAVSAAGYFPLGMPITDYPEDFIEGCLIGAWDSVYKMIEKERKKIPF